MINDSMADEGVEVAGEAEEGHENHNH